MKIDELMIGDWYYWEAERKKYPLQVTKETFALADEDIANFQPIPLTVEILEKNGFVFEHDVFDGIYPMITMIYCDYKLLDGRWINGGENGVIRFVHELQNALRLCKVDKEIIL